MPGVSDSLWSARDTTPNAIEEALRDLVGERHAESASFVPARVLNMVCVVDRQWSGEIANRLRAVGANHPSRTIVCAIEPGRTKIDAVVTVASDVHPEPGAVVPTRETVIVHIGPHHLKHLDTVVDPLVVTDIPTVVWAPHGHDEAVDALRRLSQIALLDSSDDPDMDDALRRAGELSESLYVVDLSWLRSAPWRERVASAFDPPMWRGELRQICRLNVRHHPDSGSAALLLCGWMASRLGWKPSKLIDRHSRLVGRLRSRVCEVAIELDPTPQQVRGLVGITIETESGMALSLDRGAGGLTAVRRTRKGGERRWTVPGASRGEGGILGEGIRRSLARDPTYRPALMVAEALVP